jgi:hypothetical protein
MSANLDLHTLMNTLESAPDLDLLRLRTAIDHLLQNPKRILAIRQQLHTGQEVEFWSLRDRRVHRGRIAQFKPEQLLIHVQEPRAEYFWVEYAAILFDASSTPPSAPPRSTLSRADFAVGDTVGFEGRDLIQHVGTIARLNQKSATVSCPEGEWRVSYSLLHRVVDL